jgi:hypothetical protein
MTLEERVTQQFDKHDGLRVLFFFDPEEKLRYDVAYIRAQSFWFDLKIVIRQVWQVIQDARDVMWFEAETSSERTDKIIEPSELTDEDRIQSDTRRKSERDVSRRHRFENDSPSQHVEKKD